jgi:hypothetical protein
LLAAEREEVEADGEQGQFAALGSEADFDRVVFDGGEFGLTTTSGSTDEADYLGIPGLLEPEQVKDLLRRRQAEQVARGPRTAGSTDGLAGGSTHQRLQELRRELNGLVGAWHHRTDKPHGVIHAELRSACGGPLTSAASAEELQQRIDHLRRWATSSHR